MQLNRLAEIFVPDGVPTAEAFGRITHLGIGAHQDDLEIMAAEGILGCYGADELWFGGVTVTDGHGAPRSGPFAGTGNEALGQLRNREQRDAAAIGRYGVQVMLNHPSAAVKEGIPAVKDDLLGLFTAMRPGVVYTHNLADKHPTHIAVTLRVIEALRELPAEQRPERLLGCEVWRDLDWLVGPRRVELPIEGREHIQAALLGAFDSQIAGGKRYDLAAMGRRRAHATFSESHVVDTAQGIVLTMDMSELLADDTISTREYMESVLEDFTRAVLSNLP